MNLKKLGLAATLAVASSSSFAFDVAGDGELVLNVWNSATSSSISVDLDVAASTAPLAGENLVFNISGLDQLGAGSVEFNVSALNSEFTDYPAYEGIQTSTGGFIYATAQSAPLTTDLNSSLFANQLPSWENLVSKVTGAGTEIAGADNETWLVVGDANNFAGNPNVFGSNMFQTGSRPWWSAQTATATDSEGVGSSYAYFLGHRLNFTTFEETYPVVQSQGLWTLDLNESTLTYSAIPVPAAVWMFASGLLGLAGIARRNKKA